MEETKYLKQEYLQDEEEKSSFDIKQIYTILVLNWKWFVLSIIICLGVAYIYLRYTTPIYQAQAKLLIKDETQSRNRGNSIMNTSNLGIISNSTGIDNEMEILSSCNLAQQAVTDLKLYVTYRHPGHIVPKPGNQRRHGLGSPEEVVCAYTVEHYPRRQQLSCDRNLLYACR